ncbi:hypothetical protein G4B88_030674 [Cannabis sativa]|uniref:Uncharacterized protein n=1 Tax=Cannabis sativa TaxID=3483 RepID=A0A7J6H6U7_CANSA|nr:hypothetical protein G4B88_030674 [Cannabis sativa]
MAAQSLDLAQRESGRESEFHLLQAVNLINTIISPLAHMILQGLYYTSFKEAVNVSLKNLNSYPFVRKGCVFLILITQAKGSQRVARRSHETPYPLTLRHKAMGKEAEPMEVRELTMVVARILPKWEQAID